MAERYRVIVSAQAYEALIGIMDYIAQDSPAKAVKAVNHLLDEIGTLDFMPNRYSLWRGSSRLPFAVRSMPVPPFRVVYRVFDKLRVVRVLTVEHGARAGR